MAAETIVVHVSMGGPTRVIQINGRRYTFEMHPFCGPIRLDNLGEEHPEQPDEFLEGASYWAQQGQRMEDDLCRWDWPAQEIPRGKQVGRSLLVTHFETIPARRGE